ncbi:NADP-dependent oxidoreductase [Loigolactobacillus zhaoyuanensis]|uniref:NADP-dependent oxidoreductase n=1 Tax=Loigolactobacillus zhaoyuanensis TaxID=2486017 RepID=UPI000F73B74B|nr:NADP-dependent oxidoreductase [Loigolactobacillus zhaoyuanensis]
MQSFGFNRFGDPTVFESITQPTPELTPIRVLIDVVGFALNPYDAALRRGEHVQDRPLPFPIVPGTDVVGTIRAVGEQVTDYQVGDVVLGHSNLNAYAEQVAISHNKIAKVPAGTPLSAVVGLPSVGITAYNLLIVKLQLQPNQSVLIEGATGGVGSLLVQIAKAVGAHVIGVASASHRNAVIQLGVDQFISTTDLASSDATADIVINAVNGGRDQEQGLAHVAENGRYVSLNNLPTTTRDITMLAFQPEKGFRDRPALAYLLDLYTHQQLQLPIAAEFPFTVAGVRAGHQLLEQRHQPGKIIIMQ